LGQCVGGNVADIYLAEFEKLKDEQISRSAHRDRLFHLTLVLFGGGITIALTKDPHTLGLLLLLPVVAFIAGTSHIACDRRISSIGSYIKNTLTKRIAEKEHIPCHEVLEWETFIDSDKLRKGRKLTQFLSNVFLYVLSGIGVTVWYCITVAIHEQGWSEYADFALAAFDILLMLLMGWQLIRHAYIGRSKERADRKAMVRATLIRALSKGVLVLVAAGLAAATVIHFGPPLLVAPFQPLDMGFPIPWPMTRLTLAATGAFIFMGGSVLLLLRRR